MGWSKYNFNFNWCCIAMNKPRDYILVILIQIYEIGLTSYDFNIISTMNLTSQPQENASYEDGQATMKYFVTFILYLL